MNFFSGRSFLAGLSLWAVTAASAGAARAQTAELGSVQLGGELQAERQRLRAALERVNGEIDVIKRSDRGVRDDYRLRMRLADAEALARRLTEVEGQLARSAATKPAPAVRIGVAPGVTAADGPAEREAKADILADQSWRLEKQAEVLAQRVTQLKGRLELRRRAGQMDRDPFAPLEGSKRRAVTGSLAVRGVTPTAAGAPATDSKGVSAPSAPTSSPEQTAGGGTGAVAGAAPPPAGATNIPRDVSFGNGAGPGHTVTLGAAAPVPVGNALPGGADGAGALSTQLRDVLDAGALADIRRLEGAGAGANIQAIERAIAALKARAHHLRSQSNALRPK